MTCCILDRQKIIAMYLPTKTKVDYYSCREKFWIKEMFTEITMSLQKIAWQTCSFSERRILIVQELTL